MILYCHRQHFILYLAPIQDAPDRHDGQADKSPSRSSLDVPLEEKPHCMKSTDERLDLGHGLGLLLVRQIAEAHGGIMKMENRVEGGGEAALVFTCRCHQNEN